MEKIRNLSLRKTIILYLTVSLFTSTVLSGIIAYKANRLQKSIWEKYIDMEEYGAAIGMENQNFQAGIPRIGHEEMTQADVFLSELCDFLDTWSALILSLIGSAAAVFAFYRNKIKEPLAQLQKGSDRIAADDLDFSVSYQNRDEMGQLCAQFERMRGQLAENNRKNWKLMEQEKALRAAIAHDIRAPLTILKGYQEMLLEFIPQERLDRERITEMLRSGMGQLERLDAFVETMRLLSGVEEREIRYQEVELPSYARQAEENVKMLAKDSGKECSVMLRTDREKAWFDPFVVLEILDNLVSNALRYAKREVTVLIRTDGGKLTGGELSVVVRDDGAGFEVNGEQAAKAYYHANPQDDLTHFGLGLYISRVSCEKHGGRLLIANIPQGGAEVRAVLRLREQPK